MRAYSVTIVFNDPYPKRFVYTQNAGNFGPAVAKAMRRFAHDIRGQRCRIKELSVKAVFLMNVSKLGSQE